MLERIQAALDRDREARALTSNRAGVLKQLTRLTPREREVMEMLVAGNTSKEIAAAMNISVRTVEGHRRMVLSKMNVSSATQLVHVVLRARGAD